MISWYAPDKVQVVNGNPVGMGEPYKTVLYQVAQTENGKVTTIPRQSAARPAHVETRVENGHTVTITNGPANTTTPNWASSTTTTATTTRWMVDGWEGILSLIIIPINIFMFLSIIKCM